MRSAVLASVLAASATAYALPTLTRGPVHFRITQPHSVTASLPAGPSPATVTFPTTPLQFVITDITHGQAASFLAIELRANGSTLIVLRPGASEGARLNTGVLVPAGASLSAAVMQTSSAPGTTVLENGITLSGYVQ